MSPDSVDAAARIGAGMAIFSQSEWPKSAESINRYRDMFRSHHGRTPPPPLTCDFVVCDRDAARAEALARKHIAGYLVTVFQHYELMSDHFKKAKGYQLYGETVDLLKAIGLEALAAMYVDVQAWGTPKQIIDKLHARREIIGEFRFNACFRFAGIPFEAAERSMRVFAEEVMPALRSGRRVSFDRLHAAGTRLPPVGTPVTNDRSPHHRGMCPGSSVGRAED